MPNYRGGDNSGLSPQTAELIKMIRSGTTPYQQAREREQRAIVGGAQAGLMLIGGAISNDQAHRQEYKDNWRTMRDAIENAKKQPNRWQYDANLNDAKKQVMERAIANAQAQSDALRPLSERAKTVSDRIDVSDAGVGLPYGDVWNQRAFEQHSADADVLANDMNTAKSIIKGNSDWAVQGTGIGGSMKTWGR